MHRTNHLLWSAEDEVRGDSLDAVKVADGKRVIDQLNMGRVRHTERLDEVISGACPSPAAAAPLHTEPLSSVIDRTSVSVLRLHHTRLAKGSSSVFDDGGLKVMIGHRHRRYCLLSPY